MKKKSLPKIDKEAQENSDGESATFIINIKKDFSLQQDFLLFMEERRSRYRYNKLDEDNIYELEFNLSKQEAIDLIICGCLLNILFIKCITHQVYCSSAY